MDQVARPAPVATTLLDLLWELQDADPTSREEDIVALTLALLASRRVKLTGTYRDAITAAFAPPAKPVV